MIGPGLYAKGKTPSRQMEQRVNVHVILAKMNQNKVYSRHIRAMAAGQTDIYIIKQVDRLKCYILLKFAPYE